MQVNLIYDSVGAISTPQAFFKRLTDSGISVLEFNPINPLTAKKGWEVNQRDHRKLLIVDGRSRSSAASTSAACIPAAPFSQRSKRTSRRRAAPGAIPHLQVEGPVVAEFQKLFLATWEKQKGEAARAAELLPAARRQGQGSRARHRQFAR